MEKSKLSKWESIIKISLFTSWFCLLCAVICAHITGEGKSWAFVYGIMYLHLIMDIHLLNINKNKGKNNVQEK